MSGADEFNGTDRYRVQKTLGSGAFGVVYQAWDREREQSVAIKVLRQRNAMTLYRFKQEFRALADVDHPNLVTLYELTSEADQWFFTMELVDGVDFLQYVWGDTHGGSRADDSTETPTIRLQDPESTAQLLVTAQKTAEQSSPVVNPDLERLQAGLRQLVGGIHALHQAGKLHRDIKPTNVIVNNNGRVVLLDFGLIIEQQPSTSKQVVDLVGTPEYMAPEQAAGLPISEATDWYSVGVMLYQALSGQLPFVGPTFDVLVAKQEREPPALSEIVAGVPENLAALCQDLLCRHPHKRPSGDEILRRVGGARTTASSSNRSSGAGVSLVGRQNHLTALRDAFGAVKEGSPALVLLRGKPGMGKSFLLKAFLTELKGEADPPVVLTGRCYQRESVPYKAFDNLIDDLSLYLQELPQHEVEILMPRHVDALSRVFPVLQRVGVISRARQHSKNEPEPQELRRRSFRALRELFGRLGERRTVVLAIDDLHWGDPDSADLLTELLRPPDPPPLMLIVSYNTDEAEHSPMMQALLDDAAGEMDIPSWEVQLAELSERDAQSLVLGMLPKNTPGAQALADSIFAESGGNPLVIKSMIEHLRQTDLPEGRSSSAAPTLEALLEARLSKLSSGARRLLDVITASGRPVDLEVAKQVAEIPTHEHSPLTALRASHLVRTRRARGHLAVEVYHEPLRRILVSQKSQSDWASVHLQLAYVLETAEQADPETLATHFQEGGANDKAATYMELAARRATDALAFDRAARLYRATIGLRPKDDESLSQLWTALAEALANAGRGPEAAEAYLQAVPGAREDDATDCQRLAGEQLLRSGHIDRGLEVLSSLLEETGQTIPGSPTAALVSLLTRRAQVFVRRYRFTEKSSAHQIPETLRRIDTVWSVACCLGMVDTIRGADFQTRHVMLALKAGEPFRVLRALAAEAVFAAVEAGYEKAGRLLAIAKTLARRVDTPLAYGQVKVAEGVATYQRGDFKRALAACNEAESLLLDNCRNVAWELHTAQHHALASLYYLGDISELETRRDALLAEKQAKGDLYALSMLQTWPGVLVHAARDQPDLCRERTGEAIDGWSKKGFHLQHWLFLEAQCEIDLYTGESLDAWRRLQEIRRVWKRSLLERIVIVGAENAFLRGRVALAVLSCGKGSSARLGELHKCVRRSIKTLLKTGHPWCAAMANVLRAGRFEYEGRGAAAIEQLTAAISAFRSASMDNLAMCATWRKGKLVGGSAGDLLLSEARDWFESHSVVRPERIVAMYVPSGNPKGGG